MALKVYDPKLVIMTLGVIPISGLADGEFVVVEKNEDAFSLQVGTDGEACRSRSNNNSGRVTFKLLQSSICNDLLSALLETDKAAPGGTGAVPLLVKDMSGRTLVVAEHAWIVKEPAMSFDRTATAREWIVESDDLRMFAGGN